MTEYRDIAKRFSTVRWAWKRTAALQGLAVVLMESLGIFILLVMFNYFYGGNAVARIVAAVAALGGVIYLIVRHIVKPLLRQISDEQIALYVEEHNDAFEGALLAAAEFGVDAKDAPPKAIAAIIASAVSRAEKIDLKSVVELRRLKKYAVVAVVLLVGYIGLNLLFPESLGKSAIRTLALQPAKEPPAPVPVIEIVQRPITFRLSHQGARLPIGGSLELEALLSRSTDAGVYLQFRPVAEADTNGIWRKIKMERIEKLHGYRMVLEDLNEDIQYFVSSEDYHSDTYTAVTYEPLRLEGFEITTKFPAVYNFPQTQELLSSGDVNAVEGADITVRVLCNRPLQSGRITWDDGTEAAMTVGDGAERVKSASFSFKLERDKSYRLRVMDIDGQVVQLDEEMFVVARKDRPPTLKLTFPGEQCALTPLAELELRADAKDDYGLAKAELVFLTGPENPKEYRVDADIEPVAAAPDGSEIVIKVDKVLALEELSPRRRPGDVISYYLEVTDKKGWTAVTRLKTVGIVDYEYWTTITPDGHAMEQQQTGPGFMQYFEAGWLLHQQKDLLPAADLKRQAKELHGSMLDESGKMIVFAQPKPDSPPGQVKAIKRIMKRIDSGHKLLLVPDTTKMIYEWRLAVIEMQAMGLLDESEQILNMPPMSGVAADEMAKKFEEYKAEATAEMTADGSVQPQNDKQDAAREAAEKAEGIQDKQEKLIKKAEKQLADAEKKKQEQAKQDAAPQGDPQNAQAKTDPKNGNPEAQKDAQAKKEDQARKDAEAARKENDELADQQKELAKNVKDVAKALAKIGAKDPKAEAAADQLKTAAKKMAKASQQFKQGNKKDAIKEAREAKKEVADVADQLRGKHKEKIAAELATLINKTAQIKAKQKELQKASEELAKSKNDPKKDPKLKRDYKKQIFNQIKLKAEMEQVRNALQRMKDQAKKNLKSETSKKIDEAVRNLERKRVEQKMSDAVVDLNDTDAKSAKKSQEKAAKGLESVVANLKQASDTMAADPDAELRRARNEAERIEETLKKLEKEEVAKQGDVRKDDAKQGKDKKGEDKQGDARKGEKTAEVRKKPLTKAERKKLADKAAFDAKMLAEHLNRREFADKKDRDKLNQMAEQPTHLGKKLEDDKASREVLRTVVKRVKDKLEAEYKSRLESKKLFAAQREECPPQYRELVNKYYESLSTIKQ